MGTTFPSMKWAPSFGRCSTACKRLRSTPPPSAAKYEVEMSMVVTDSLELATEMAKDNLLVIQGIGCLGS